jgi:hypothetical protein
MIITFYITSSATVCPTKNVFKRKNGKKESKNQVTGLRMRSAISPEGWQVQRGHYARAAYGGHYLGCPFSPFRMKTSNKIPCKIVI